MEREIGEIFEYDGVKLICLQDNYKDSLESCKNCYFFNKERQCKEQLCVYPDREDENDVYFKEIKE